MKKTCLICVLIGMMVVFTAACGGGSESAELKGQYEQAAKDLRSLEVALVLYETGKGEYPKVSTIQELKKQLVPDCINEEGFPLKDPWGNDYLYQGGGASFAVASSGSDGKFEGFAQKGTYTELAGKDVIFTHDKPRGTYIFKK